MNLIQELIYTMRIDIVDQVSAGLSLDSLRQQVIASNIANRDSAGYQRLSARFADTLGSAWSGAAARGAADVSATTRSQVVVVPEDKSIAPSLEQDMVALSANSLHFDALARALARYFSIGESIATGGRT